MRRILLNALKNLLALANRDLYDEYVDLEVLHLLIYRADCFCSQRSLGECASEGGDVHLGSQRLAMSAYNESISRDGWLVSLLRYLGLLDSHNDSSCKARIALLHFALVLCPLNRACKLPGARFSCSDNGWGILDHFQHF